jgi:hypothetical protein
MMTMRAPAPSAQAISTNCCSGMERERTSASGETVRADALEELGGGRGVGANRRGE